MKSRMEHAPDILVADTAHNPSGHSPDPFGALARETAADGPEPSPSAPDDKPPANVSGTFGSALRGPYEEPLREIFEEVLGLPRIGVDDDFFALGGQSLHALRIVGRARRELGVELTVSGLFATPTVAGLASRAAPAAGLSYPAPHPRPRTVPLSAAQRQLWCAGHRSGLTSAGIALAHHLTGRLDIPALRQAVIDVITRHTPLRTLIRHGDGQPYQHRLPPPDASSALSLVHTTPGALAARVARFCDRAFDPGADRPLRTALFRLNPAEHVLVLAAHPLAADHGSLGPLLRDLSEAYSARRTGARPDWAPLQPDYTGHTLGERARDGLCAGPGARAARTPAAGRRRDAEPIAFRLSPRLGREIAALAREAGATVLMVLQTAVAATLSTLGAGAVVPVDVYVPGRPDASLDLLVGRFAHTLTLRADVSGDPSFRRLLARVRAVNLAAYDRRDLPHACPAAPSGTPFLPVTLSLDDGERARPELPGLAVRALPTRRREIRCALAISFTAEPAGPAEPAVPSELAVPSAPARYGAGGMTALIEYRPELLDEPAASRLAHCLVRLLERSLSAPDRPLSLLALPAPELP